MDEDKNRDAGRYLVRFPRGLRERLETEAEANKRSLNAEITIRLEQSLLPKSVQVDDFPDLDIRGMIWKEMYSNFHKYRVSVIESIERKLSRDQPTPAEIEARVADPGAVIRRANERELDAASSPEEQAQSRSRHD